MAGRRELRGVAVAREAGSVPNDTEMFVCLATLSQSPSTP
jgi:hypothetical protein